jgi:replicative DNA helicase
MTEEETIKIEQLLSTKDHEIEILGDILTNNDLPITDIQDEFFNDPDNKTVLKVFKDLHASSTPITILIANNKLQYHNRVDPSASWGTLLAKIEMNGGMGHENKFNSTLKELRDCYIKREFLNQEIETKRLIVNGSDPDEIIERQQSRLLKLSDNTQKKDTYTMSESVSNYLSKQEKKNTIIPTNLKTLDNILGGGFKNSQLIVVAARPGQGKTAFSIDLSYRMAKNKTPSLFISLEMPNNEIIERYIMREGKVDPEKKDKTDQEETDLQNAYGKIPEYPITIHDPPSTTVNKIRTQIKNQILKNGVKIVFIDYLGLISGEKKDGRVQEVGGIVRGIKQIAKETDVPIVLLSQLNRDVEKRQVKRPQLSDLRESGDIEQTADIILFLHYEEDIDGKEKTNINGKIIVAKNRRKGTGDIPFNWRKEYHEFIEENPPTHTENQEKITDLTQPTVAYVPRL